MRTSLPLLILLKTIANILTVYAMHLVLPQYFVVAGGLSAYILIGILIGFLNVLMRPILTVILLPFKLFASIPFLIITNSLILWAVLWFTSLMNPSLVTFAIAGGVLGWIIVSIVFGLLNWLIRSVIRIR